MITVDHSLSLFLRVIEEMPGAVPSMLGLHIQRRSSLDTICIWFRVSASGLLALFSHYMIQSEWEDLLKLNHRAACAYVPLFVHALSEPCTTVGYTQRDSFSFPFFSFDTGARRRSTAEDCGHFAFVEGSNDFVDIRFLDILVIICKSFYDPFNIPNKWTGN